MTKTSAGVISLISILLLFHAQCLKLPNSGLEHDGVTVCYVSTWAVYRPGDGKFGIDDLDPSLCTHLVYAFAGLNETSDTIRSLDPFNDLEEEYGKGTYKKMASLKSRYPHLKVTLAIGGWNEGSEKYSTLAASPTRRKTFVESVVQFLKKFGFDGFDLDWEYPAKRGGVPEDKHNFVSLVKELKAEMVKNGWILTAAVGAGKDTIDAAYDLPSLSDHLDYIHLMCYDYHGAWDLKVGANAPLRSNDKNDVLTVEYSVKYLLQNGVSPKKLVLGVPFYGRTFLLKNPESKTNETENKGFQGPFTREDGFLGYNEICNELKENSSSWHQWFDEETKSMYASNNEKVIAFDNARSIKEKVKLAAYNELAGVMVWSIDTDDFRGTCKEAEGSNPMTFPLLRSINRALAESIEEVQNEIRNKKENTKNKNPNGASRGQISIFATTFVFLSIIVSTYRYS